ncbi:MAG: hypothetical protein ABIO44_11155 [Saprospiraceae bacterium]
MRNIFLTSIVLLGLTSCHDEIIPDPSIIAAKECADYLKNNNLDTSICLWKMALKDDQAITLHESYGDYSIAIYKYINVLQFRDAVTGDYLMQTAIPSHIEKSSQVSIAKNYLILANPDYFIYTEVDLNTGLKTYSTSQLLYNCLVTFEKDVYYSETTHSFPYTAQIKKKQLGFSGNWDLIYSANIPNGDSLAYDGIAVIHNSLGQKIIVIEQVISRNEHVRKLLAYNEDEKHFSWESPLIKTTYSSVSIFSIEDELYYMSGDRISRYSVDDGKIIWSNSNIHVDLEKPKYNNKSFILRTYDNLISVERSTGKTDWEISDKNNSNQIRVEDQYFYLLTRNSIKKMDMKDGKLLKEVLGPSFNCYDIHSESTIPLFSSFSINSKYKILCSKDNNNLFGIKLP